MIYLPGGEYPFYLPEGGYPFYVWVQTYYIPRLLEQPTATDIINTLTLEEKQYKQRSLFQQEQNKQRRIHHNLSTKQQTTVWKRCKKQRR